MTSRASLLLLSLVFSLSACDAPPAKAPDGGVLTPEQARCAACNGRMVGMGGDRCACATRDAGELCRDGRDCEGTCLIDDQDKVASLLGRGRCAAYRATFGCFSSYRHEPKHPDGRIREEVCKD